MIRLARRLAALAVAFAILSAQECSIGDLGDLLDEPGRITVTNRSATEVAVIAILAEDAKSYPTLGGGATASIQTNVGGTYEVRVVMTPESATAYREDLRALRSLVEKAIAGAPSVAEKTQLYLNLAGLKAAIQSLEIVNAAGCTGQIRLDAEQSTEVSATVEWVAQSGAGFWDVTCGSN